MQNQLQNFSYPLWGVNFNLPKEWTVSSCPMEPGQNEKLVVQSTSGSGTGAPTVILELKDAPLAKDMEHLLNEVILRLNSEIKEFELVNKATQQVRGEPRGVLVLKFNADGKQHVAQKMLLAVSSNRYLEVTASAALDLWGASKQAFQAMLASVVCGEPKAAPIVAKKLPASEVEILFHASEVGDSVSTVSRESDAASLVQLLQSDFTCRNFEWLEKLLAQLSRTPLHVPREAVFRGADGYSYFALFSRAPEGVPIRTVAALPKLLEELTNEGLGVHLDPGSPHSIHLTFGDLWYFREQGGLKPFSMPASWAANPGWMPLVGPPTEEVIPLYARRALKSHLKYILKIDKPAVSYSQAPGVAPPQRYLVFNIFEEDCRDREEFEAKMRSLIWLLPNNLAVAGEPKRNFNPAKALFL